MAKYAGAAKENLVHTDLCVGGNYYVFSLMTLVATFAMYIYVDIDSGPPRENERYVVSSFYAVNVRNTAPQINAFHS